ncbi:RAB24 protein, partial [Arenaria interpres]|nr:RAB24 protein [Arenaria interpres]
TIGAAFVAKVMSVGEQTVTLGIWVSAGAEISPPPPRLPVLTGGDREPGASLLPPLCPPQGCRIYLCGTKSDLLEEDRRKRGVDFHDVQDYAEEIKADLFETSSKTGQSVDELFQKVAEDYVHFSAFQVMTEEKGVDLGQRSGAYLYSCCHH